MEQKYRNSTIYLFVICICVRSQACTYNEMETGDIVNTKLIGYEHKNLPDEILKDADIKELKGDIDRSSSLCYNRARTIYLHDYEERGRTGIPMRRSVHLKEIQDLYRQAIELNPSNADAHCGLAETMITYTNIDEEYAEFYGLEINNDKYNTAYKAIELDPTNIAYYKRLLDMLPFRSEIFMKTGENMIDHVCLKLIDMEPTYHYAYYRLHEQHDKKYTVKLLNGHTMSTMDLILTAIDYSPKHEYIHCLYYMLKEDERTVTLKNGTHLDVMSYLFNL